MRSLMLTMILALTAGPLWADTVALVLGNERYERLGRVAQADDLSQGAVALTRAGIRTYSGLNAETDEMRSRARDFMADRDGVTGQIIVLAGQFVTDGPRTWFLGRDAVQPTPFAPGDQAILVETLLRILAQTPGQSILVLGHDARADEALGLGLREGVGNVMLPQGVTLVQGTPGHVADLLADTLAVPGRDVIAAVDSTRRLTAKGYLPATLRFDGGPALPGGPQGPVVVDTAQDTAAWQEARRLDTANAYVAYLAAYPEGAFAGQARDMLDEIRSEPNRAARLSEEALALDRDARRAVQRDLTVLDFDTRGIDGIFGPGTRRAITNWQQQNGFAQTSYLTADQITRIDAQAARRAQELETAAARQRAAEEARDRAYWEETGASRDEAGLRAYLDRYPDGTFSDGAKARLAEIETARRNAAQAQDRAAWDQAANRNTVPAYRDYLQAHPQGAFRQQANSRIAGLQRDTNNAPAQQAARAAEQAMGLDPLTRRIVEARLAQLGLDPGPVDGTFDAGTRRAIRLYQRDRSLARTGFLNQETVSRMLRDGP